MKFRPIDLMWDRVEVSREESDTSLFLSLLYLGELITKLVATGLVSMIERIFHHRAREERSEDDRSSSRHPGPREDIV